MLLQRERPIAPARAFIPPPAPLPSLADALRRRASIFGPVEADPAPAAAWGPWQAISDAARRVVDRLTQRAAA